jgi:carboxylesterase type B
LRIPRACLTQWPQDYGFFTPAIQSDLNSYFVSQLGCAATDSACLAGLSAADIITAANATTWNAGDVNAAASGGENLRPVQDGALITTPLDSTAPFPPQTKPIMLTTAAMDAAYTIYYNFDAPLPGSYYEPVIEASYSDASTTTIVNSAYYKLPNTLANDPNGDIRPNLEVLGTDGIWRCPAYTFAREWAAAGAKVYVGEYVVGSSYPGNEEVPACTIPGVVCHQDDIMIVVRASLPSHPRARAHAHMQFGTAPSPNSAQSALIAEVQARYAAFLATGNPNVARYPNWAAAGAQTVNGYFLGNGGGSVPAGGCQTNLWGTSALPYDYQVYGI